MPYVVLLNRIGQDGSPIGQPIRRNVRSETEALAVMQGASLDAHKARQRMLLSLYDHSKKLLVSYSSHDRALLSFGAHSQ